MSSREVFPDEELRHRIMDFIMAAAQFFIRENLAAVHCRTSFINNAVLFYHVRGWRTR